MICSSTHHPRVAPPDLPHSLRQFLQSAGSCTRLFQYSPSNGSSKIQLPTRHFPPPRTVRHGETSLPFVQTATRRMYSFPAPPLVQCISTGSVMPLVQSPSALVQPPSCSALRPFRSSLPLVPCQPRCLFVPPRRCNMRFFPCVSFFRSGHFVFRQSALSVLRPFHPGASFPLLPSRGRAVPLPFLTPSTLRAGL
jgi:hypothetical protein